MATLLFACGDAAELEAQRAVRIAGAVYLGDLPTVVADQRGFFAAYGLEAEVEFSDSGKRNMARLRAGEVDFALMTLTPFVLDRLADPDPHQPDDPVILANLLHSSELTQILVYSDAGVERPADLDGLRVAFERGTNTEFVWWLFEQFHGIDRASIRPVSIPFSATPEALLSGRLDAAVLPEPWASRVEAQVRRSGKRPLRRFDARNLYSGKWVIVTTRRHVREHRQECRDVLAAYHRAMEFIERKPAVAIAIYQNRAESADHVLARHWDALDYGINLDWTLIAGLQEQFRWARQVGYHNAGGPVRVLDLIEAGPLHEVWPEAVHLSVAATPDEAP